VEHLEIVYETTRAKAVRITSAIVGRRDAEDAVQSAALYLYRRLDTLPYLTPDVFIMSAKMKALGILQSAWYRRFIGYDPEDLEMIERNLESLRRGRPRNSGSVEVRLPKPVA
jgi:hypothetical protein